MAHSQDLRRRVVDAYNDGEGTYDEIAERFKVGRTTVVRWVKRDSETGDLEPLTKNNRRPLSLDDDEQAILRRLLHNSPDCTDQKLADALEMVTGKKLHRSAINRYWKRWGYTRKKRRLWPPSSAPHALTQ